MSQRTASHLPRIAVERHTGGNGPGNGAAHSRIGEIQRTRMIAAMAAVASEYGAANATVAHVVEHAGVSRRTFYEIFTGCEDCLLASLDEALVQVAARVVPPCRAVGPWQQRIRLSLTALLLFIEENPSMGRLLVVESIGGGVEALRRRQKVMDHIAEIIDQGRGATKKAPQPPALTAQAITGGAFSVIHARMLENAGNGTLAELVNPLMSMIVLPYLGAAAAQGELHKPTRHIKPRALKSTANPLKDIEIRLTYRTIRALTAVALYPGSSNRAIADAAGIADQGQVSKLLARLERLGLIENAGIGAAVRGEPNAWTLTKTGGEVHAAIGVESSVG